MWPHAHSSVPSSTYPFLLMKLSVHDTNSGAFKQVIISSGWEIVRRTLGISGPISTGIIPASVSQRMSPSLIFRSARVPGLVFGRTSVGMVSCQARFHLIYE